MRAPNLDNPPEVSPAQLAANRSNAQHSTGPRTPEGKARVAQNAVKHGLFSRNVVALFNPEPERKAEYDTLLEDLLEDFSPGDRLETNLVHRLAALTWRIADLQHGIQANLTPDEPEDLFDYEGLETAETLGRMEVRLSRELSRVIRDLTFLQRYKLDFADKVHAHRHRVAKSELAQFDVEGERQMRALRNMPYEDEDTEGEEFAAGTEDGFESASFDAEAEWRALRKRIADQRLATKHVEQTQPEDVQEAPKLDDRSIDLT